MLSMHLHDNSDSNILISDISDHLPSLCKLGNFHQTVNQMKYVFSRNLTDQKLQDINALLDSHDWNNILVSMDVDENFTTWHNIVLKCINEIAPEKKKRIRSRQYTYSPWITRGLKKSMAKKNKLYKDWIHDRTNDNKLVNYKEYRKMLQKVLRVS